MKGNQATANTTGSPFPPAQLEHFTKLFSSSSIGNPTSSIVAPQGVAFLTLVDRSQPSEPLIIDYGALDHMTSNHKLFRSYTPHGWSIQIENGSFISVASLGSITLSPNITLSCVLYIPNLFCNLLSIGKITDDLNCTVTFNSSYCLFQDRILGQTIGCA